jgi:hypothetical protein
MNRLIFIKQKFNLNRRWFQFWKPMFIEEKYYLKIKNGFLSLGKKVK